MKANQADSGFIEVPHTADWSIYVWGEDLASLLIEAARGMVFLQQLELEGNIVVKTIMIGETDPESLLVTFLSEILALSELEGMGLVNLHLSFNEGQLIAKLDLARIKSQSKYIKAVTYHMLKVSPGKNHGLETTIVFDV